MGGRARLRYDSGPWKYGVDILEFRGEKVCREMAYSMDAWEAPQWRARWRAAPPSQPPGEPANDPPGTSTTGDTG